MPKCQIVQSGNDYAVKTPYHKDFPAMLKSAVSAKARNWDNDQKAWIVGADWIKHVLPVIEELYGEKPEVPELVRIETETKYSFQLDYVGIPKERDGQAGKTALGLSKGQWKVIFSEAILRKWFEEGSERAGFEETLFSLLLCNQNSTDQEIRSGYRRLARQWHPDVCKEENTGEMFKRISDAYQILSDPQKRARYQAGLAFERESNHEERRGYSIFNSSGEQVFIPPLRCGFLTVMGAIQVGRLRVSQILSWLDVTNEQGQTMVSSWSKKREAVVIEWV